MVGRFGRRLALMGGGGGIASASQQIITQASADGWTAVYDPTNPDTRTLRTSGSDEFATEIADGLGNETALTQSTEANQMKLLVGQFGQLDALDAGSPKIMLATFASSLSQPHFIVAVAQHPNIAGNTYIADSPAPRSIFGTGDLNGVAVWSGTWLDSEEDDTNDHILAGLSNGASSEVWIDSTLSKTGDASTSGRGGVNLGAKASGSNSWTGPIGPVLLFDGNPSAAVRTRMFDLLHDLTGIAKA